MFVKSEMLYICKDGQGENLKEITRPQKCDITSCEQECTQNLECKGFDFTKNCKGDTCRLYSSSIAKNETGDDGRKYCKKTEGKIKRYCKSAN